MKKFFKSLMLGLAIIPMAFLFAACGKDPEPPKYDKEANVKALNSAIEKVEAVGDNYTQTMTTNSTGVFDSNNGSPTPTAVTGDNGITAVSKFDGGNFVQEIAGQKIYYIDGVMYVGMPGESSDTETTFGAMEIDMPFGTSATDLAHVLAGLKDFAFTTNKEAVVATDNNVTITIELANLLNIILDVASENTGSSLETLVNELIDELIGDETTVDTILADIEEWANETTVEDVVGEENLAEIKILAGTVIAYVDLMQSMSEGEPTITLTPVGDDVMAFNSEFVTTVFGVINSISSLTIDEIIGELELMLELPEGTDIYDFINDILEDNSVASIVTDMQLTEEVDEQTYNTLVFRNSQMISGYLDAVTLNKVTAIAKLNLVNNTFDSIDLVFDLDADVAIAEGSNMDIVGKLEACFELSQVGTTEIELPADAVITGLDSVLVKLSDEVEEGDDAGKIIVTGVESKIFDVIAPNGFTTDEDAVVVTKVAGSVAGEYTYTITLSTAAVDALAENNVLMVKYTNADGDHLMFNVIVDVEIPEEEPVA